MNGIALWGRMGEDITRGHNRVEDQPMGRAWWREWQEGKTKRKARARAWNDVRTEQSRAA